MNIDDQFTVSTDKLSTPLKKGSWANYPLGVFAQFVKRDIKFTEGVDILIDGNVPNGAGLSSSAALEVVTAVAINEIYKCQLDKIELVKMSQKAEHEFAGVMCGIMDQFASGMGAKDRAIFLNCDTLDYELVPVILENHKIVIANTNSPHSLDSGQYNERVAQCQAAVDALAPVKKVKKLVEVSLEDLENNIDLFEDETVYRRARHVVTEISRTTQAVEELKKGNLKKFGQLMNESHFSLRDDYEVTGSELDAMAEEGQKIDGVLGSRMTGGGFGGCTVSIVQNDAVETFVSTVGKNYEARTGLKADFYIAEIGDGGKQIFE